MLKKRLAKVEKKIQQLDGRLGEVDENLYNVCRFVIKVMYNSSTMLCTMKADSDKDLKDAEERKDHFKLLTED